MDTPTEASTPMTGRGPDLPQADHDRELAEDPRALTILSTEHWSLLRARGLAYNASFTRAGMYLTFISMSFVGLALLTQAIGVRVSS